MSILNILGESLKFHLVCVFPCNCDLNVFLLIKKKEYIKCHCKLVFYISCKVCFSDLFCLQWASLVAQCMNPLAKAGHAGSVPGSGRSPGEEKGNLLKYSCLVGCSPWGRKRVGHNLATEQWQQALEDTPCRWLFFLLLYSMHFSFCSYWMDTVFNEVEMSTC